MDKISMKRNQRFNDQICIIMVRSNRRKCRGGETRQLTTHHVQQKSSKYQNMKYWSIELPRLCWNLIETRKKKKKEKANGPIGFSSSIGRRRHGGNSVGKIILFFSSSLYVSFSFSQSCILLRGGSSHRRKQWDRK